MELNKDETKVKVDKEKFEQFLDLMHDFRRAFKPKSMYKAATEYDTLEGKKKGAHMLSAAVILSDAPHEPEGMKGEAFRRCIAGCGNLSDMVDALDVHGRTALIRAVMAQNIDKAKILVEIGHANANVCYTEPHQTFEDEDGKTHVLYPRSCPLYDAVEKGNLKLVKLLLDKGKAELKPDGLWYDKPGKDGTKKIQKQLVMLAVVSCMADRNNKDRRQILKELAKAGADFNVLNESKRSGLHLSVSSTTDEADQALDLELALLRGGCSARALDERKRLPLHYAFVKIGNHRDSSRMDPIEVVSLLVEAMEEERGSDVDVKDEFGSTPLHYAAYRGATVSCLLLLQKGKHLY